MGKSCEPGGTTIGHVSRWPWTIHDPTVDGQNGLPPVEINATEGFISAKNPNGHSVILLNGYREPAISRWVDR